MRNASSRASAFSRPGPILGSRRSGRACAILAMSAARRLSSSGARLQLLIRVIEVRTREDLELAFAGLQSEPADAMLIYSDTFFLAHAERIANLAIAKRLPVFSTRRPFAEAGILASYGAELDVLGRRSAAYVQRILNGAKPGDLSVELPTKFSLTINLTTAKAL